MCLLVDKPCIKIIIKILYVGVYLNLPMTLHWYQPIAGLPRSLIKHFKQFKHSFMKSKNILTEAQTAANRTAIHTFIAQATAKYGRGSVILLPEFEEVDGAWIPVGNGIRPTAKDSAFLRLGKMTLNQQTGKPQYIYTNHFGDSTDELGNMLAFLDPTATIGSAVRGIRVVIQESLVPFSRTNPSRDIKWADQKAGIACLKLDESTGELVSIYRRTKAFFADDEGNYPVTAVNTLIQHDNAQAISDAAYAKFQKANAGINTPVVA